MVSSDRGGLRASGTASGVDVDRKRKSRAGMGGQASEISRWTGCRQWQWMEGDTDVNMRRRRLTTTDRLTWHALARMWADGHALTDCTREPQLWQANATDWTPLQGGKAICPRKNESGPQASVASWKSKSEGRTQHVDGIWPKKSADRVA